MTVALNVALFVAGFVMGAAGTCTVFLLLTVTRKPRTENES